MGFEVEIRANMPVNYVLENGTKEQKAPRTRSFFDLFQHINKYQINR